MITHQEIINRLEVLGKEYSAAYKLEQQRQELERANLQKLCGGIGHVFANPTDVYSSLLGKGRKCVFCRASSG